MCITSIKLCAKCLTTANIPLPPANPINVLEFVTVLKKQSSVASLQLDVEMERHSSGFGSYELVFLTKILIFFTLLTRTLI